jgi:hypothetical protein
MHPASHRQINVGARLALALGVVAPVLVAQVAVALGAATQMMVAPVAIYHV